MLHVGIDYRHIGCPGAQNPLHHCRRQPTPSDPPDNTHSGIDAAALDNCCCCVVLRVIVDEHDLPSDVWQGLLDLFKKGDHILALIEGWEMIPSSVCGMEIFANRKLSI